MTPIEHLMTDFVKNGPPCRQHKEKPRIGHDGVWFIECPKGCTMHDGENAGVTPIMIRWVEEMRS
jgi:hypothetical protein